MMVAMIELDEVLGILRSLGKHGVQYVLVGGVAGIVHGLGRTTEDVDVFVRPTEENLAALRAALREVYPGDASIEEITAADLAGDYPTVRYGPPHGRFYIDLMSRLGEAFSFDDLEWRAVEVAGTTLHVATPRTLYRMKRDTVRARDRADAEALRELYPDEVGD
jgi:hypothetical protein